MSVLLPTPEAPTTATIWPSSTDRSSPHSTANGLSPTRYALKSPVTWMKDITLGARGFTRDLGVRLWDSDPRT